MVGTSPTLRLLYCGFHATVPLLMMMAVILVVLAPPVTTWSSKNKKTKGGAECVRLVDPITPSTDLPFKVTSESGITFPCGWLVGGVPARGVLWFTQ
jgi:hypothetical protein